MNRGTVIMLVIALASAGGAFAMRPQDLPPPEFEDTGTKLFADFEDPTRAASLEVVGWNEEGAEIRRFSVKLEEGRWIIPSHHDYPADATERMGKAASSFIGIERDIYYTDDPKRHADFGLLDPEDPSGEADEKAKRITIKDESGAILVDILVGKPIPDKDGYRYVRLPDDRRVYGTELELDISTNFADWIEKDLLHIERDDIVSVVYDPYTVDETEGKVIDSNPLEAKRQESSEDGSEIKQWVLTGGAEPPKGKELDQSALRQMIGAIDRLQIEGVRARPERLTFRDLQSKGFFVNPNSGRLFGNEGEVHVITEDGVTYTMFFGEVTFESGLALTAGEDAATDRQAEGEPSKEKDAEADQAGEEGQADADGGKSEGGNRYLFVDVRFDPAALEQIGEGEDDQAQPAEADAPQPPEDGAASADGDDEAASGQARAKKLAKRFGRWFFVISDKSFQQIHKERDALFKDQAED